MVFADKMEVKLEKMGYGRDSEEYHTFQGDSLLRISEGSEGESSSFYSFQQELLHFDSFCYYLNEN